MSLYQLREKVRDLARRAAESDSKSETQQLLLDHAAHLQALKEKCTHKYIVVQCSEYRGSYSYDYEDGHKAHRQCLVCGVDDSAWDENFQILNGEPIGRFELSSRYERSQPGDVQGRWSKGDPLQHPLRELIVWVKKYGYHAMTKKRQAEIKKEVEKKLAEKAYQEFKKANYDRLHKEFAEEYKRQGLI